MTTTADIAIIGGGVIGLALARALAKAGAAVTVIDAGARDPAATHAAAGMLAPSFEHGEGEGALGAALYHFGARGLALWPDYAAALEEEDRRLHRLSRRRRAQDRLHR
ncbi:MAG: FAD-dependent oxidoreductase [Parvularculaceae bacterium]